MSGNGMISRRTMLRGLGVGMALPMLDSMIPANGLARAAAGAVGGAGGAAAKAPVRSCFMFLPNGVAYDDWAPTGEGAAYELSKTLAPLKTVKDDLMVLSGLALDGAKAKGDGGGDHARSAAAFLTGAHPVKTAGKDIRLGISVDQLAAQQVGDRTRFASLELGLDKTQEAGNCDSGYSCAYVTNISWRNENTPVPKEVDPGALFDRLFGTGPGSQQKEQVARRQLYRKSILDFVTDDSKRLNRLLGAGDKRKFDEFTNSIREIEKRIESAKLAEAKYRTMAPPMERPDGIPGTTEAHMKLMCDLLVLAFQMDVTRISSVMVAREGSNRRYTDLGISEGHHALSHHGRKKEKLEQIQKIDAFHVRQFAYFLEKMKSVKEGAGTLLDNSMVMIGSGISDGNRHSHVNLPVLLAGRAGGAIKPGRHVVYPKDTPLCNLYASMLDNMGVKADRFGDSTGRLPGLNG